MATELDKPLSPVPQWQKARLKQARYRERCKLARLPAVLRDGAADSPIDVTPTSWRIMGHSTHPYLRVLISAATGRGLELKARLAEEGYSPRDGRYSVELRRGEDVYRWLRSLGCETPECRRWARAEFLRSQGLRELAAKAVASVT